MSSGGNTHWCYQCSQPIRPLARNLVCPYCDGGFIQELPELTGPHPGDATGFVSTGPFHDARRDIMDALASAMRRRGTRWDPDLDVRTRPGMLLERRGRLYEDFPDCDPISLIFNPEPVPTPRRNDLSDFLMHHHGLHELIEQLSVSGNRGPPPASRSAIDAMPTIRISQRHLNTDAHCPVCQDRFELGARARQMPCDHIYHSDCIVPWLVEHNSCPVCRVELPSQASGNVGARPGWNFRNGNSSGGGRENSSNSQGQVRWNPFALFFNWNPNRNNRQGNPGNGGSNSSGEENNGMRWPFDY